MLLLNHNWHTIRFLANEWGKDISTVQKWARSGFLIELGFKVRQVRGINGIKQWWIYIPPDSNNSNNMHQRNSLVDISLATSASCLNEGSIQ